MGRLRTLELHNFKSYRGLQTADFTSFQFVSIIGTNGSGKSNMMDAISFVLGLQSSSLRSSKVQDLVHRNVLSDSQQNDYDASSAGSYVKLDYERGNGEILELKRSILSNGSSEYRVDGKIVPHSLYLDTLAKENIVVKAKNFLVFQGQIEEVAQQSPEDLATLIEQISGSRALKPEYDELKSAVEEAKTRSLEVFNKRKAQHAEVKDFNNQRMEADRYKELVDDRESTQLTLALAKAYNVDKLVAACEEKYSGISDELDVTSDSLEIKRAKLDSLRRNFDRARKSLNQNQKRCRRIELEKEEEVQKLAPMLQNISSSKSELESLELNVQQLTETEKASSESLLEKEQELEVANQTLRELEDRIEKMAEGSGLNLDASSRTEYEALESELARLTGPEQMQLVTLGRQKRLLDGSLQDVNEGLDVELRKKQDISKEIEQLNASKVSASSILNGRKDTVIRLEHKMDRARQETSQISEEVTKIQRRFNQTVQELAIYNLSLKESQREKQYREDLALLKSLVGSGVRGPVYDLFRVKEKKVGVAMDTVFGKHFHSIVVDSQKLAEDCIKHLKEHRKDVKSFIPLDRIVVQPINRSLRQVRPNVRMAIDCISYPPNLKKAAEFVCGSTLICEDLVSAREVRWGVGETVNVKIVCLDGTVISRANLISSGPANASESRLSRQSESVTRKLKSQYEEELRNLKRKAEESDAKIASIEEALSDATHSLEKSRNEYDTVCEQIESRKRELKECDKNATNLEQRKRDIENQLLEINGTLDGIQVVLNTKRCELFGDFAKRNNIADIVEFHKLQTTFTEESTQQRLHCQKNASALNNEIARENDSLARLRSRLTTLRQRMDDEKERLEHFQSSKDAIEQKIDEFNNLLTESTDEGRNLLADVDGVKAEVERQEEDVNTVMEKLKDYQKQLSILETELYKLRMDRVDILRNCKMGGQVLPLESGCLDDIPLGNDEADDSSDMDVDDQDAADEKDQLDSEEIKALKISSEIVIDYSSLDKHLKGNDSTVGRNELVNELAEIAAEIEKLSFNNKASEHFKSASARYNDLGKQVSDAKMNHQKLLSRFEKVKSERKRMFDEALSHISECIGEIYGDLTKSDNSPGGSATIYAQNTSEPYLGGIVYSPRPATKRAYDITQLSGGEKSIAAIALLFAIHSYRKSPFFILDEVDAALDAKNVAIVAEYIKRHKSDELQFIVISLKAGLYQNSDALIGIYRNQEINSSQMLTLDLENS